MNKRHLAVAVVSVLALSSSTIASAEGGSHRRNGDFDQYQAITPISLTNTPPLLTVDTSTSEPRFTFDTSTVTVHIDFDTETATTNFDTTTAVSGTDDESEYSDTSTAVTHEDGRDDDHLAGNGSPILVPPAGLTPNSPSAPELPTWIKKPHAKSNDENTNQDGNSWEDSHD